MPAMDRGMLVMNVKMPVGTSLEESNRVVTMIEEVIRRRPEVRITSTQVGSSAEENAADQGFGGSPTGPHEAQFFVGLKPVEERELTDIQVLEEIRKRMPKLEGVKFEAMDMGAQMMGGAAAPVEIKLFGKDLGKAAGNRRRDRRPAAGHSRPPRRDPYALPIQAGVPYPRSTGTRPPASGCPSPKSRPRSRPRPSARWPPATARPAKSSTSGSALEKSSGTRWPRSGPSRSSTPSGIDDFPGPGGRYRGRHRADSDHSRQPVAPRSR